ncbi:rCG60255 [Rattus norvegicus]|uniref:RCG60255 n=1 Tax=Rattus norvegicus TaxID=10116 RepID=A6HR13_RAT|nr:rCG60255 [Rattus norvegicus]
MKIWGSNNKKVEGRDWKSGGNQGREKLDNFKASE